ncbi:NNP family nitrate/nitrite transporter-like MFS transporter [Arthrobacter silviterrae]|uniref:NarK/NasA family nitrate transporter n=1 Tax=Arthrobacter silviterrae TaxID=2026658 RepID=A0ABX0DMB0_9MICC|nr:MULTISPECIES: MFS transporter [Arthrobacter]MDQ0275996.1 NNP family nitrate/nitrite transporter-like MFS transporter [Arthrobacter silviterrae]NGN85383.1 NarK/NasA family nitrate transporter [Arthrobacter silviterrae]
MPQTRKSPLPAQPPLQGQALNLALATAASVVGFWAWNIIATLSTHYARTMELSAGTMGVLVAMPIFVGSLGRIVVGILTDRYGGRALFTFVLLATIPTVLLVALGGSLNSFALVLAAGFLLGVAGTVFAVGIPFVSAWYPPARRGFATGVFGAGMGGTALAAFLNPRLVALIGYAPTHFLIAGVLAAMAVLVWFFMKNAPGWTPNTAPVVPKLLDAAKLAVTWKLCFLYAVVFGGFVSFATYLPTYLRDVYSFSPTDAGARTAGFALAAVIARPIGGVLADKIGSKPVVVVSVAGVAVLGWLVALQPVADVQAGPVFLAMAAALGLGAGGVFAWVGVLAPDGKVGAITGIVSAAGGLGGYFPPLIMGMTYNPAATNYKYAIGLSLLVATALVALVFTWFFVKTPQKEGAPQRN